MDTRIKLSCNGMQIFDIDTSISTMDNCGKLWSADFAQMRFVGESTGGYQIDTASDFYRQYETGEP